MLEPTLETGIKLLAAGACGALLGWDREAKQREAGLRTHILVALGACLFTLITLEAAGRTAQGNVDPGRAISGVAEGIGFLGAGAILRGRNHVRGLTTAAGIWVVAALGVAAAFGSYVTAALAVLLAFFTLTTLAALERAVFRKHQKEQASEPSADADG
jgi:putative Mg2+ transporter-C (MgtC) family protein